MKMTQEDNSRVKYVIHPGFVRSRTDGDIHYISASKLMQFYGVRSNECIIVQKDRPDSVRSIGLDLNKLIHLYPRYDGNYNLKGKEA